MKLKTVAISYIVLAIAVFAALYHYPESHLSAFSILLRFKSRIFAKQSSEISNSELPGIYDISVIGIDGNEIDLSQFKGKVALVINVASQCGYTESSYKNLAQLFDKYRTSGFTIFAFPCNQFGAQEPDSDAVVDQFAKEQYGAAFPIFAKSDVNGEGANEVFKILKSRFPGDIAWNFHGIWLVDRSGTPVVRFDAPDFRIIEKKLKELLKQ